jgi:peptide/nickel transport system substrate-binding protein
VPDEEYVLVPNEHYWDQSAVKWKEVVIKVLTDPSARFRAVQTGQVDVAVMAGALDFLQPAKDADLQTFAEPANTRGLIIADRAADGPLKDVRVRQALNYAIDRKAITSGLIGDAGTPTSEFRTSNGFDPDLVDRYPYDPQKARDLLAEAGYPDGFSLTMLGAGHMVTGGGPLAQAVASYWDDIGVTANFELAPTAAEWVEMRKTLKYQVLSLTFLLNPVGYIYGFALQPNGPPPANPFGVTDPELEKLFADANVAKDPGPAFQKVMSYVTEQAIFVPVWDESWLYVANDTVKGIELTEQRPVMTWATEWSPAS